MIHDPHGAIDYDERGTGRYAFRTVVIDEQCRHAG